MRWLALAVSLAVTGCGGGEDGGSDTPDAGDTAADVCAIAAGTGVSFDPDEPLCNKLSSYRFFVGDLAKLTPNDGVVPYDLISPLFSDYAAKDRFIWLPPGTSITYDADESFRFPVGAVVIKTFSYYDDARQPAMGRRIIETRLLFHRSGGWEGVAYVWNEAQNEGELRVAGAEIPVTWIDGDGMSRQVDYLVPNKNQCKECHEERDDTLSTIGPKARHLNRDYDYGAGPVNQLAHLTTIGYLSGAPADPSMAPKIAAWDDESADLDERARGWLDINCSHCHNPKGPARTSGLDLLISQTDPSSFGVCKPPVAAGAGSGGLQYDIVPGDPDKSIIVFRLESTELDVRMPELGRSLVHAESAALIRDWITAMPGDCSQ